MPFYEVNTKPAILVKFVDRVNIQLFIVGILFVFSLIKEN
jgi:hypothetical protein